MTTAKCKTETALRTIGEVVELLEIPAHIIRFWESKFPQIKPVKYNTRRYYNADDITLLSEIKMQLYEQNKSMAEIAVALRKHRKKTDKVDELLAVKTKLLKAKDRLSALLN